MIKESSGNKRVIPDLYDTFRGKEKNETAVEGREMR